MNNKHKYIAWLTLVYILIVWVFSWTEISSRDLPLFTLLGKSIASISQLSASASNTNKALFELVLAWMMSFIIAYFFFKNANWEVIKQKSFQSGGHIKTALKSFSCAVVLLLVVLIPHTPSPTTRFGRVLLTILQNDHAYIWGVGILFTSLLAWMGIIIGFYLLTTTLSTRGE
ncbi:hypothetical protein [Methylobacillus sp. MM3]|uniref:hypothetical protein n=1 Tax=Methylobacillus sp. MM3 TaxID=1848039 RepID=UPI0010422AE3|nr:hypothetical protein [Methylobacillus sp. MM3]